MTLIYLSVKNGKATVLQKERRIPSVTGAKFILRILVPNLLLSERDKTGLATDGPGYRSVLTVAAGLVHEFGTRTRPRPGRGQRIT